MNDDFENQLRLTAITGNRTDPTPAWKSGILTRAMEEANGTPRRTAWLPPRWLMASWGTAWAACLALHVATPESTAPQGPRMENGAALSMLMPLGLRDPLAEQLLAENERPTEPIKP